MNPDRERESRAFDPTADDPVDLVWPVRLRRPPASQRLVYLDLNHWIGLGQAATSDPKGARYVGLLEACRAAVRDGRTTFPLSGTHYMEVAKISNPRWRADLATIMEELSGFTSLVSRSDVMPLELDTALDQLLASQPTEAPMVDLLGWGSSYSVGVLEHPLNSFADRLQPHALEPVKLAFERDILAGPQSEEAVQKLRDRGWRPDAAVDVAQERADQEKELAESLNQSETPWRKGRLIDVVTARELSIELVRPFVEGLTARGATSHGLFDEEDHQAPRRFTRSMPSSAVAIEMKTLYHRSRDSRWNTNTIFDIDAMALSVPYCDAVLTENHACTTLKRSPVYEQVDTALFWQPEELEAWLQV